MTLWAEQYIGEQWTVQKDCFYWFRKIQKEVFGRELAHIKGTTVRKRMVASMLTTDICKVAGWHEVTTPKDGDGVLLRTRVRPHHIGVVTVINGEIFVVHAVEGSGVLCSSLPNLFLNRWEIVKYYEHR